MLADRYAFRNRGDHEEPVKIGSGSMKENRLPVLAHCCSLGMSIADGYNYEIRDDRKAQGDSWEPRRKHPAKGSAIHMDDIGGHPRNWEPVLDAFPKLKLCMAHFGGQEVWDKTKKREEKKKARNEEYAWNIEWRDKMLELINNNENVYTDISYFSLGSRIPDEIDSFIWRRMIVPLSQSFKKTLERFYRPRSGNFKLIRRPGSNDEILLRIALRKAELLGGDIRNIAKNMAGELKKSTRLKERIMMGTDWAPIMAKCLNY